MEISITVDFAAAHRLPYYDGPCFRLHGHNYRLQVIVQGKPNPNDGMVRDFDVLKKDIHAAILSKVDHHNLNDLMDNPTAENLIVWMWENLKPRVEGLKELRLWETPEFSVTYRDE